MNFQKGGRLGPAKKDGTRSRTGKAGSFKKALQYYLHDKRPDGEDGPHPLTSDRVGFVFMENLPPVAPGDAWKEMKFTADAARHLKEQTARAAATEKGTDPEQAAQNARKGRPTTEPGYVYSLQWHPDDFAGIDAAERDRRMIEAARETLRLLGLSDRHAVIVQHLDTAHPHVHVIANRIDMDTGQCNDMANDEDILAVWCFEQELKAGVIRSPDRYEKRMEALKRTDPDRFAAILAMKLPGAPDLGFLQPPAQGQEADKSEAAKRPRKPRNHQNRQEWKARKGASTGNAASLAATKIKRDTAESYRHMKQRQQAAYDRRKVESAAAWNAYQDEKRRIMAAYKPQIDRLYARPAKRGTLSALQRVKAFWTAPGDALRQAREKEQWRRLGRWQWEERRAFQARERTMLGKLANSFRYSRLAAAEQGRGQLAAGFTLLATKAERERLFALRQEQARTALRDRQKAVKKTMADPIRARRDVDLKRAADAFAAKKDALARAHAVEQAKEKAERLALSTRRANAWEQWRGQFGIKAQTKYAFNDAAGRRVAEARTAFNQVAPPAPEAPDTGNKTATGGGRGKRVFTGFADTPETKQHEAGCEDAEGRAFSAFNESADENSPERSPDTDRGQTIPPPGSSPKRGI
jgi:hypothetical protein